MYGDVLEGIHAERKDSSISCNGGRGGGVGESQSFTRQQPRRLRDHPSGHDGNSFSCFFVVVSSFTFLVYDLLLFLFVIAYSLPVACTVTNMFCIIRTYI